MTKIDRVLWLLLDGEWHTLNSVAKALQIDIGRLEKIATFLEDFNFIQLNAPRVRITPETKRFLERIMHMRNQTDKDLSQN